MRLNMKSFLTLVLLSIGCLSMAQEMELPLLFSAEKAKQFQRERSFLPKENRGNGTLQIPFFDDFSTYSLPTDDPEIPDDLRRWEDDFAHINQTMAILPPTIGVATLDGLDETGYPYQFSQDSYGLADELTSRPIDLGGLTAENSVYLHFRYQCGGFGNAPNEQDSLIVEFLAPGGGEDAWFPVWSTPGDLASDEFLEAFIPVDDVLFLQDGFKFRFKNYSTLSGNLDHWNIDYVFLNNNIDPENFDVVEIAFVYPPLTLLNNYVSMPWSHFIVDPETHMLDQTATTSRNLSATQADNISSGFKVDYEGDVQDFPNGFQTVIVSPFEIFDVPYFVNDGDVENFVYDTSVNDTCAIFDVTFYENSIGLLEGEKLGVLDNDSIGFQQTFTNYYALDDGSAERAYALNETGGKVAMRFDVEIEDTLLGLFIHFTPFQNDVSNETFLLRAWTNDGGQPGAEIGENFNFHSPQYYNDGYNIFSYYEYDEPLVVSGNTFVGFIQNSDARLNVGLDKNTNNNASRLYYQLGLGAAWQASGIQGTVMIRPVFSSGKSFVWNGIEEAASALNVYPNPVQDQFTIQSDGRIEGVEVYNMFGQLMHQESGNGLSLVKIDASIWAEGSYILVVDTAEGVIRKKLIKQ